MCTHAGLLEPNWTENHGVGGMGLAPRTCCAAKRPPPHHPVQCTARAAPAPAAADRVCGGPIPHTAQFFSRLGLRKLRFKPAFNPYTEPSMEIFRWAGVWGCRRAACCTSTNTVMWPRRRRQALRQPNRILVYVLVVGKAKP